MVCMQTCMHHQLAKKTGIAISPQKALKSHQEVIFWWHRLQIRKAHQILPKKHLPRCVGRNPNGDVCGGAGRCGGTGAGVRLATKASRADPEGVAGTHTPHSRRRTLDWGIDGGCLEWSFAGVGCRKTPRAAPGGGARGAETPLAKPISFHPLIGAT